MRTFPTIRWVAWSWNDENEFEPSRGSENNNYIICNLKQKLGNSKQLNRVPVIKRTQWFVDKLELSVRRKYCSFNLRASRKPVTTISICFSAPHLGKTLSSQISSFILRVSDIYCSSLKCSISQYTNENQRALLYKELTKKWNRSLCI